MRFDFNNKMRPTYMPFDAMIQGLDHEGVRPYQCLITPEEILAYAHKLGAKKTIERLHTIQAAYSR